MVNGKVLITCLKSYSILKKIDIAKGVLCLVIWSRGLLSTAPKIKFFTKDFFNKCDPIRRKLRIWLHLLKKSLMENFVFLCSVQRQ